MTLKIVDLNPRIASFGPRLSVNLRQKKYNHYTEQPYTQKPDGSRIENIFYCPAKLQHWLRERRQTWYIFLTRFSTRRSNNFPKEKGLKAAGVSTGLIQNTYAMLCHSLMTRAAMSRCP